MSDLLRPSHGPLIPALGSRHEKMFANFFDARERIAEAVPAAPWLCFADCAATRRNEITFGKPVWRLTRP